MNVSEGGREEDGRRTGGGREEDGRRTGGGREEDGRRTGGGRGGGRADTELKTKTPHVNVGKKTLNYIISTYMHTYIHYIT